MSRRFITISCGNIGFDGAEPILRKSDPWLFRTRRISAAHLRHHCRYDSRLSLSEYFPYLIPRLYGGDVTVMSTQLSGSCAIRQRQPQGQGRAERTQTGSGPLDPLSEPSKLLV